MIAPPSMIPAPLTSTSTSQDIARRRSPSLLRQSSQFGEIEISVNHTEPGLPQDKADNILDAFFTTKPQGGESSSTGEKSVYKEQSGWVPRLGSMRRHELERFIGFVQGFPGSYWRGAGL